MSGSRKIRPTFAACGVCFTALLNTLLIVLLWIPHPASAAAMVVFDPTNWAENVAQLKQIEQSLATARAHYETAIRGHAQHRIDRRGYRGQRSLRSNPASIAEDDGIEQRCSPASAPSADLRQYCAQWVRAQNRRYNAIVTLQAQHQQREDDWLAMLREREQLAAEESGLLQSHLSRMAAFQAQLQIDLGFTESLLANHDRHVAALHSHYVQAVRTYLNGSHSADPAQRIAQQQLLRAALLVAGSRRR